MREAAGGIRNFTPRPLSETRVSLESWLIAFGCHWLFHHLLTLMIAMTLITKQSNAVCSCLHAREHFCYSDEAIDELRVDWMSCTHKDGPGVTFDEFAWELDICMFVLNSVCTLVLSPAQPEQLRSELIAWSPLTPILLIECVMYGI